MKEEAKRAKKNSESEAELLIIEPFYGGSHQQQIDLLQSEFASHCITLPAKKWKWRLRSSAAYISSIIPDKHRFQVLFCSSMLNLAELLILRQDLLPLKKILYFHENQLVYPNRHEKERDFQFGWNQIMSSIAADVILFNSDFNRRSFLDNIKAFLKVVRFSLFHHLLSTKIAHNS